jgi:outer membrane biosynthesis protein TonB
MIYKFKNLAKQSFFKEARLTYFSVEEVTAAPNENEENLDALNVFAEAIYDYSLNAANRLVQTDQGVLTDYYSRRVNENPTPISNLDNLKDYIGTFNQQPDSAEIIARYILANLNSQSILLTSIQYNDSTKQFTIGVHEGDPVQMDFFELVGPEVATNLQDWQEERQAANEAAAAELAALQDTLPQEPVAIPEPEVAPTTDADTVDEPIVNPSPNADPDTTPNPEPAPNPAAPTPEATQPPAAPTEAPDISPSQIREVLVTNSELSTILIANKPSSYNPENQDDLLTLVAMLCDIYDANVSELHEQGILSISDDGAVNLQSLGDRQTQILDVFKNSPELFRDNRSRNLAQSMQLLDDNPNYTRYRVRVAQNDPDAETTTASEADLAYTESIDILMTQVSTNGIESYSEIQIPGFVRQTNMQQADFRRLFIQKEIRNADQIQTCLTNLNFSVNEFSGLFHDGLNRRIDNQPINTQSFLRFTDYANESFEVFQQNLIELMTLQNMANTGSGNFPPELNQELQERRFIYLNVVQLIETLKSPETIIIHPTVIDPDYVSRVEMPVEIFNTLNPNDRGRFNQSSRRDAMTLVAIMCELYGATPNDLIQMGYLSLDQSTLGQTIRTSTGVPIGLTLKIERLGPLEVQLISVVGRNRNIFTHNGSAQNLSEIMYRLTEHSDYPELRDDITESLVQSQDPIQLFLNQVANGNTTGSFIRRNRLFNDRVERLDNPDIIGAESSVQDISQRRATTRQDRGWVSAYNATASGAENDDIMTQQFSEAAFRNYLVTHISEYNEGGLSYNQETLMTFLNEMLALGKVALVSNVTLSDEERTELLATGDEVSADRALTENQIELIRLGFVTHINNSNLRMQAVPVEGVETSDSGLPSETELAINNALPVDRHPSITSREVLSLMSGLNAGDFSQLSGNDIRLGFGTDVIIMQNPQSGELRAHISGGTQTGLSGTTGAIQDAFVPMMSFKLEYNPADSNFGISGGLTIGIGTIAAGGEISYTFPNQSEIAATISAGVFNFIPGVLGTIYWGTSYNTNIENAQERIAEAHLENLTNMDTITDIAEGQLSREEILQYANNEPALFAQIPDSYEGDARDDLKVTLLTQLCQQIKLAGVTNARGIAFGLGLSEFLINGVIPTPPTPIVKFQWGGRTITHYSMDSTYNQDLETLGSYIVSQARGQDNSEPLQDIVISISTESGQYAFDGSNGATEITRGTTPIVEVPESDETEEDITNRTIEQLNEVENTTGLHFEAVTDSNNYKYAFSIDNLNIPNGESLTPTQVINLYSDPTSGITLHLRNDNKIGISFANDEQDIPPTFHISRTQVHNPLGEVVGATSICFSNRAADPSQIINSPLTNNYLSASSSGIVERATVYNRLSIDYTPSPEEPLVQTAELGFDDELIRRSEQLLHRITSTAPSLDIQVTPEMQAIATRLLGDANFMNQLEQIGTFNGTESQRVYPAIVQLIRYTLSADEYPSVNRDTIAIYLQSVLIPETYIDLNSRRGRLARIESINSTTNNALRPFLQGFINTAPYNQYYDAEGNLHIYTAEEQESIIQAIIDSNMINPDNLDNLDPATIAHLDTATLSDATNPPPFQLGTRILTAAGTSRDSADARGLRPLVLADPTTISFLNGTQRELDNPLAEQFVRNLFEQPFPSTEFADWTANQRFEFFDSETVTKLISLTYQLEGVNLPVINLIYDEATINTLDRVYEIIEQGNRDDNNIMQLTPDEIASLSQFIEDAQGLQNGRPIGVGTGTPRQISPDSQSQARVIISPFRKTGTVFLENCGNLSVYQNLSYGATVDVEIPREVPPTPDQGIIVNNEQTITRMTAENSRNLIGFSFEIFARPSDRPSEPGRPDLKPPDDFGVQAGAI